MKNNFYKSLFRGIGLLVIFAIICLPVSIRTFADTNSLRIDLPVNVEFTSSEASKGLYGQVKLERISANAPLPKNDTLTFQFKNQKNSNNLRGIEEFEGMLFNEPGIYEYIAYQVPSEQQGVEFDRKKVHIKISIMNTVNNKLQSNILIYDDSKKAKLEKISFFNKYTPEGDDKPFKKNFIIANINTGDLSNIWFWMGILLTGFSVVLLMRHFKRKK